MVGEILPTESVMGFVNVAVNGLTMKETRKFYWIRDTNVVASFKIIFSLIWVCKVLEGYN